ncbi:hypothetical protein [Sphingomonas sp.]|uniref:hypothetical protein n=1 Tax=Sphingomonas sp. TaxID=28214 RepID=UPI0035B35D7C
MHRFVLAAAAVSAATIALPATAQETQATAAAKFSREFKATDTNKDGVWSKAEVAARIGRMGAANKKFDKAHTDRLASKWFAAADANKDGKVTEKEAQALLAATFQAYDANRDGRIGAGERSTAKKAIQGR